mgnify:CR=1 FL=1
MARKPMSLEALQEKMNAEFLAAITDQSDLACALIVTTFIEHALITILSRFFIKGDTSKNMFKEGGNLGDFGKCTNMAYCLGFISDPIRANLATIGDIRNRFAHNPGHIDFQDSEISKLCLALTMPKGWFTKERFEASEKLGKEIGTSRDRFVEISKLLFAHLIITAKPVKHQEPFSFSRHW